MPTRIIGSYKVMLDTKNRFNIPAPFKKYFDSLGDGEQNVILRRAVNAKDNVKFIQAFPSGFYHDRISKPFENLDPLEPATEEKIRDISSNSFQADIKHNRILIPQNSIEHAALDGQLWVVGMFDYFEIWNFEEGNKRFKAVS